MTIFTWKWLWLIRLCSELIYEWQPTSMKTFCRYLASGESLMSLQGQFRIGVATIHNFIPKVLRVIWHTLQPTVLKMTNTSHDWQKIFDDFNDKCQFPHC